MSTTMSSKKILPGLAAATAIGAMGFLPIAPAAQAAPKPCTWYGFDGEFPVRGLGQTGATGWTVTFNSTGSKASGSALAVFDDGGTVYGTVSGGIDGRAVNLSITWNNKPNNVWTLTGTVEDDGLVHNGGPSSWTSSRPLKCIDPDIKINQLPGPIVTAPEAPAPQAPPAQPEPPAGPKTATVVGEPVDVYSARAHEGGKVIGVLPVGTQVQLGGACQPQDWCQVSGNAVPNGQGWVWGHLQL